MTTPTTMEERFEEKFDNSTKTIITLENFNGFTEQKPVADEVISFIQSEIDLAVEKREKEIVDMVSEYPEKLIKIMPYKMTKFKSQNEVDMEDFNDNKPSQKWLDWLRDTFDLSEDSKTEFWIDVFGVIVFILGYIVLFANVVLLIT